VESVEIVMTCRGFLRAMTDVHVAAASTSVKVPHCPREDDEEPRRIDRGVWQSHLGDERVVSRHGFGSVPVVTPLDHASTVRVRFAPSPTGYFHVGSARTALFNWLVARRSGGTFVLRIEDTDTERNREQWVDGIVSALHWLSMDHDEGPYRQSERRHRYDRAIDTLWDGGHLYACDCDREAVEDRNKAAGIATPGYDGFCRDRALSRRDGLALRFRTPDGGVTTVDDVIRGRVDFPCSAMDDFVLVKASGAPLFVLANVVDDIDMRITHVIRGEDLLPTTPKGIMVWDALASANWLVEWPNEEDGHGEDASSTPPLPVFAHLPMLVNEQRKKLSKRRDPVAVESYREQGYLPEAFVNYLALLGWGPPGGEERFTVDQLVNWFRLEDVNHSPAFFDIAKLTHLNGEYIRAMEVDAFVAACGPWLLGASAPWPDANFDMDVFRRMAPLVQERVAVLGEVPTMVDFLFLDEAPFEEESWKKAILGDDLAETILISAFAAYESLGDRWSPEALHSSTLAVGESVGRKLGKAQAPVRVAVTGRRVGPPLFEALDAMGADVVLDRLRRTLDRLCAARAEVS
jgi:glutamyl-tRNA synthetase